jgi:DNA-binding transcriptional ArsR family regulator
LINHIDVSSVLRGTVSELYSNLVTRPTGAAVRGTIEQLLGSMGGRTLTVIDFTHVNLLDFSCADEIIAKLLLRYCDDVPPRDDYFVFRGIGEAHMEAIESVLERHGLALVVEERDGIAKVIGTLEDAELRAWQSMYRCGRPASADEICRDTGMSPAEVSRALGSLARRRLLMRNGDLFEAVGRGGLPH